MFLLRVMALPLACSDPVAFAFKRQPAFCMIWSSTEKKDAALPFGHHSCGSHDKHEDQEEKGEEDLPCPVLLLAKSVLAGDYQPDLTFSLALAFEPAFSFPLRIGSFVQHDPFGARGPSLPCVGNFFSGLDGLLELPLSHPFYTRSRLRPEKLCRNRVFKLLYPGNQKQRNMKLKLITLLLSSSMAFGQEGAQTEKVEELDPLVIESSASPERFRFNPSLECSFRRRSGKSQRRDHRRNFVQYARCQPNWLWPGCKPSDYSGNG